MRKIIMIMLSISFTLGAIIYWFVTKDLTNALLMMIMGELVDMPYRIIRDL